MANEDRIEALRKRVHRQDEEKPIQASEAVKPVKRRSERGRHTLYLDREIVAQG